MLLIVLFLIQQATSEETFFENYTPHEINVQLTGGDLIGFPSLGIARVTEEQQLLGTHGNFQIRKTTYGSIVGLPEPKCGIKYIVSMVVLNANAKTENPRTDLVGPDTGKSCIRDATGKIVAVTGFTV